jgi:hypothetical protein
VSVIREIQIIIDNEPPTKGEFSIEVEQVEISSFGSDPDPNWTFIDTHGHFHAYTADMKLPTLDERAEWHEYFEPDEETGETGYTTLHLHCRICDEEIRPGRIDRGGYRRFAAGRTSWTVRVNGEGALRDKKSVRIIHSDQMHFGIGEVVEVFDDHGRRALVISGVSELAQRKAPARIGG